MHTFGTQNEHERCSSFYTFYTKKKRTNLLVTKLNLHHDHYIARLFAGEPVVGNELVLDVCASNPQYSGSSIIQ